VETWKLGAPSQLNEDIKLRATLSSDIRAPGIGELFSSVLISTQQTQYPPGGPLYNVHQGRRQCRPVSRTGRDGFGGSC